jgi:hypothetical protein
MVRGLFFGLTFLSHSLFGSSNRRCDKIAGGEALHQLLIICLRFLFFWLLRHWFLDSLLINYKFLILIVLAINALISITQLVWTASTGRSAGDAACELCGTHTDIAKCPLHLSQTISSLQKVILGRAGATLAWWSLPIDSKRENISPFARSHLVDDTWVTHFNFNALPLPLRWSRHREAKRPYLLAGT